jgi:hypothetical protein
MGGENRRGRVPISRPASKEPGDALRNAISELESRVDAIANALMGTEEFAGAANLASRLQTRMQKGVADHMSRQLAYFNMPSREDITAIGERLVAIDDRLVRVEHMLARLAPAEKTAPRAGRPPRTRKPAPKTAPESRLKKL